MATAALPRAALLLLLLCFASATNVTYDHRALVIDGVRRVLVSGSIHYPRSTPDMWPGLIQKSKDGGLDVIETYVFWEIHEPVRGQYDFEGRKDLVRFVKAVADAGLYVHLRIGPYVGAEWNYGGFPLWLHFIPGIKFRTNNEPFKIIFRCIHWIHSWSALQCQGRREALIAGSKALEVITREIFNKNG